MNPRYKLTKLYPGLPKDWEIGMTVGMGDNSKSYHPESSKYSDFHRLPSHVLESCTEYWKVIDWEILAWCNDLKGTIRSVKRHKDDKIFSIGDAVYRLGKDYPLEYGIISEIEDVNGIIQIKDSNGVWCNLNGECTINKDKAFAEFEVKLCYREIEALLTHYPTKEKVDMRIVNIQRIKDLITSKITQI